MGYGYTDDQFFNISRTGESGTRNQSGEWILAGKTQTPFTYPGNVVRYFNYEENKPDIKVLQRGYMRSLLPSTSGTSNGPIEVPSAVCQFQFNPQTIRQNVQQNPNVTHFIMQPPEQYAQPMMGNVNFQFDLLFDRSAELNTRPRGRTDTESPWNKNGPEQIGVLHDLSRLFAVIGQGLSQDQLEYAYKNLKQQYNANPITNTEIQGEGDDATTTTTSVSLDEGQLDTFLNLNLGNAGFLLPLPVRVVFSSLYIVEGLVNSCEVQFTRFTTTMVPMQCFVSIVMEAKYVGFAKKDTFFTYSMQKVLADQDRQWENRQTASTEIAPSLVREIPNVTMWVGNDNGSSQPFDEILDVIANSSTQRRLMMTIDNLIVEQDDLNDPVNANALANRMENGQDLSISVDSGTYELYFYGDAAISQFQEQTGKTRDENPSEFVRWLVDNAVDATSPNTPSTRGNLIVAGGFGVIDDTSSASTKDELQDLRDQIKGEEQRLTQDYRPSDYDSSPSSHYYCFIFEFQITAKYNGEEFVGRQSDRNYYLARDKGVDWDTSTVFLGNTYTQGPDEDGFAPVIGVAWPDVIRTGNLPTATVS